MPNGGKPTERFIVRKGDEGVASGAASPGLGVGLALAAGAFPPGAAMVPEAGPATAIGGPSPRGIGLEGGGGGAWPAAVGGAGVEGGACETPDGVPAVASAGIAAAGTGGAVGVGSATGAGEDGRAVPVLPTGEANARKEGGVAAEVVAGLEAGMTWGAAAVMEGEEMLPRSAGIVNGVDTGAGSTDAGVRLTSSSLIWEDVTVKGPCEAARAAS